MTFSVHPRWAPSRHTTVRISAVHVCQGLVFQLHGVTGGQPASACAATGQTSCPPPICLPVSKLSGFRLGLPRRWPGVTCWPRRRPHYRCCLAEGVADAGFPQFALDSVRGPECLPTRVISRQPDDAPPLNQVEVLTQEKLPALVRRGAMYQYHAQ